MRVIHHDGRVGDAEPGQEIWQLWRWVEDGSCLIRYSRREHLRPLGPIEAELRARKPGNVMSPCVQEMYCGCWESLGRCSWLDVMSEALEACARIWEQHGVAL